MSETTKELRFYVCPTPECPHYYGTSGMGDLTREWTGLYGQNGETLDAERARTRGDCNICLERGIGRVPMVPLAMKIDVPTQGPKPVDRPTSGKYAAAA